MTDLTLCKKIWSKKLINQESLHQLKARSHCHGNIFFLCFPLLSQYEQHHLLPRYPFLPPATKLWQGNVFTPVYQSFFSQGGVSVPMHAGIHTPGRHPLGRHPLADTPSRQTPPGQTPPSPTATAADGTHPTGMQYCCCCCCNHNWVKNPFHDDIKIMIILLLPSQCE